MPAGGTRFDACRVREFVRPLCPHTERQGLPIVAGPAEIEEMMEALLAGNAEPRLPSGLESPSAKFEPILGILGQFDAISPTGVCPPADG